MASKSKEDTATTDKRAVDGGKVQSRFRKSSRSSSDEDLRGVYDAKKNVVRRQAETMEFSPALGRPDRVTTIRQIPGTSLEDFVVRASKTSDHVLIMGSPSMLFHPLRCPFKEERCEPFRAHAPQYLKEHLESKHNLRDVQVNLACPCPAVCNVVKGQPRECHSVKYDPMGGVLEGHMGDKHPKYLDTIKQALYIRDDTEEQRRDIPEEVKDYMKYLETGKKLPAWTREDPRRSSALFPSQRLPEKVILGTVVKDKDIQYTCSIPPCRGDQPMVRSAMSMHLLHEPGHYEITGVQARFFERCPKCDLSMLWNGSKMLLHVRAMHPKMLGEPSIFTEAAKAELAKLVEAIKGKVVGRAIGDTAKPGDSSDGTKAHYLHSFRCHVQNCKAVFSKRDHLEWHIKADHHREWNKSETTIRTF